MPKISGLFICTLFGCQKNFKSVGAAGGQFTCFMLCHTENCNESNSKHEVQAFTKLANVKIKIFGDSFHHPLGLRISRFTHLNGRQIVITQTCTDNLGHGRCCFV